VKTLAEELRATNAARAGNLSPVPAEHELLDVIGNDFTEREKANARLSRGSARDDLRGKIQRLHDDLPQHHFEHAVRTDRETFVVGETRTHRIKANGERAKARLTGREQLSREVEQQVQLEIQATEIRRVRRVIVGLVELAVFFESVAGLQDAQVAFGIVQCRGVIDLLGQRRQRTGSRSS
jgi:hypothetical protein